MTVESQKHWQDFVQDLDRREPQTQHVERTSSKTEKKPGFAALMVCRYCSNPFNPEARPKCRSFLGSCLGIQERMP